VIIGCPSCRRTYRLDEAHFRPEARLRCTRCGHVFVQGTAPGATPAPRPIEDTRSESEPRESPVAPASTSQVHGPARAERAAAPGPGAGSGEPVVVLADAGRPFRKMARPLLENLGCRVVTAEMGTAAFKAAVADKPALMVVSVHLAGLSGVAICEGVKGSPHLRSIRVALVGSELSADLFNRDTALAYGADLFLDERMEEQEWRDGLSALLGAAPGAPVVVDDPIPAESAGGDEPGDVAEEIARLARIMLSDLRLYNPDRFTEALRAGRLFEAFKDELARGRDLVDHRFPGVAGRQDLLHAALSDQAHQELTSPS
jgi:predicted Zn finger-like uncharacterized protein